MDLNLSDEQRLIQQTARSFFANRVPLADIRRAEAGSPIDVAGIWREIASLGWTAMAIPTEHGGDGGSFLDQSILLEEFGRALAPLPYRATCVDAVRVLLAADKGGQHSAVLQRIASGEAIVVVALDEPGHDTFPRSVRTKAERSGDGYRLNGLKAFVPYANLANQIICVARLADNSLGLFLVDSAAPGVTIKLIHELSEDDASYTVALNDVEVAADRVIGNPAGGLEALRAAREFSYIAQCAEMVGAMDQALKLTVTYAQNRTQFGRPIGSFQAVQSLCVDMLEAAEGSSNIVHEAAWQLEAGIPSSALVAMCRGWVAEALGTVALNGHQVHGAIGFTLEHDMQLYSRRMVVAQGALGGLRATASEVLGLTA